MSGSAYPGGGWLGRYGTGSESFTYTSSTRLVANIAGDLGAIRRGTLSVRLGINQGDATFQVANVRPVPFSIAMFGLGSFYINDLLFRGRVQESTQSYEEITTQLVWNASAVDSSAEFNRHLIFATYTDVSASAVALDLLTHAPDFTSVNISPSLANVTVAFTGETLDTAFATLASLIGGYYYRDLGYDVHLFITEAPSQTPDTLDVNCTTLQNDPPLAWVANTRQVRNRVFGIGASVNLPAGVIVGQTAIPLTDVSIFNSAGTVLLGTQRVSYTTQQLGGQGTLVGPGAGPSSAQRVDYSWVATNLVIDSDYLYAVTYLTAGGETVPSPTTKIHTTTNVPNPTTAPTLAIGASTGAFLTPGATYQYAFVYSMESYPISPSTATTQKGPSTSIVAQSDGAGGSKSIVISATLVIPPGVVSVHLYRTDPGGSTFKHRLSLGDYISPAGDETNDRTVFFFGTDNTDSGLGATTPGSNTTGKRSAIVTLPIGGASVTQRRVYRTVANGAQLKLVATIANNTSTTYSDTTVVDGSLGANAPTSDTSGLTSPTGTIATSATSMIVAGTGIFSATGGWVLVNGAYVSYTGVSSTALTGIPATGPGSIQSPISYGAAIVNAAALMGVPASGVGSITVAMPSGTSCSLYTQRDDVVSQTAVQALEAYASDGIYEYKITDSSLITQASLDARCDADLVLFASVNGVITVTYRTIDRKTLPGRPVHINLPAEGLVGDFVIQSVNISNIDAADNLPPWYDVTATSVRFSLEDLLKHAFIAQ